MSYLQNIFSDLWDKRLLPVVIVLLIAAVAIPLLLLKGEQPQPTISSEVVIATAPVNPALTDQLTVTLDDQVNKRKRLDAFKKKDPFKQQGLKKSSESESSDVTPTEPGGDGDTGSGDAASGGSDTTDGGSGAAGGGEGTSTTGGSDSTSGESSSTQLYERTITLRFGLEGPKFLGDDKIKKNLSPLSPLPSAKNPIIMYMGMSANSPSAVFFVDRGVTVKGEGTCMPNKSNCSYLYLRVKSNRNEATLYRRTDPDRKYGIKLKDIDITEVSETSSTSTQSKK